MSRLRVRLVNWRCIDRLEVELAPVTVLLGKNSSGKSSLAYAVYFLARLAGVGDPDILLRWLYGVGVGGVARRENGGPVYPVVVEAGGSRFEARGEGDYVLPRSSPWADAFLLPSTRIALLRLISSLGRLAGALAGEGGGGGRPTLLLLLALADTLREVVPVPPLQAFSDDLLRLYGGQRLSSRVSVEDAGRIIVQASLLYSLVTIAYEDPYVEKLRLPLEQAPDGAVDTMILEEAVGRAPPGSLVVVEEPENQKNPLLVVEVAERVSRRALERGVTLLLTTHSDLVVNAVLRAVEKGVIRAEDVAVYYLERSRDSPWTRARRLRVYSDGTIDEIPHAEEVVARLF